jgi:hypothetical protein
MSVAATTERKKVGKYRQIMREVAAEVNSVQVAPVRKPAEKPAEKKKPEFTVWGTHWRPKNPLNKIGRKVKATAKRKAGGSNPFGPLRLFQVVRDTSKAVAVYQKEGTGAPQEKLNDFTPAEHYALTPVLWVQDIQQAEWERNGEWTLDAGSDNPDRLERFRTWQEGLDEACTWSQDKQTGDVVMRFRARDGGGVNIFQADSTPAPVRLAAWERERRAMLALDARHKPGNGQLQAQRKAWEKTQP